MLAALRLLRVVIKWDIKSKLFFFFYVHHSYAKARFQVGCLCACVEPRALIYMSCKWCSAEIRARLLVIVAEVQLLFLN